MPKDETPPLLKSVPPPWHSIAFVGGISAASIHFLPTLESLDKDATIETFTRSIFPDVLDLKAVGYIRLLFAISVWFQVTHTLFISPGWIQKTNYLPGTKLKSIDIPLKGLKTQTPFTSWSWLMVGIYSTLSSGIALLVAYDRKDLISLWMLRVALISWETAAPLAALVSTVVRYAIWPRVLEAGSDTSSLKNWRNMFAHNLNSVFCLTELFLLGGLPLRVSHASLAPLFGCVYILFTWNMTNSWADVDKDGAQFIYFFFDTTLPGYTPTIALMALVVVLATFFLLFFCASYMSDTASSGLIGHIIFTLSISSMIIRVRD